MSKREFGCNSQIVNSQIYIFLIGNYLVWKWMNFHPTPTPRCTLLDVTGKQADLLERWMSRTCRIHATLNQHLHCSFQRKADDEIEKKQKQIRKYEMSLKKLSEEFTKANEIIHKLQNEVKSYHSKVKGKICRVVLFRTDKSSSDQTMSYFMSQRIKLNCSLN